MRKVFVAILACLLLGTVAVSAASKKKVPCAPDLASCPDEGCGTFDKSLNLQKNLRESDPATQVPTETMSLADIKNLDDPENFEPGTNTDGSDRSELRKLGEGKKVMVLAYLLVAKAELSGESCNCGLQTVDETDNHLVLVTKQTVDSFPVTATTKTALKAVMDQREPESITAEFTPRIRLDQTHPHPNFTRAVMQPMIDKTKQRALLVRVTGMLMFDSEHFIRNHLVRVNNWEIHPVLKMEFCTNGIKCRVDNDAGWKSVDDL